MKRSPDIIIALAFLIFCIIGCSSANRPAREEVAKLKPATAPTIKVQSEPGGKTGIYQQDLRLIPTLFIDGKPADGEHAFGLFSMASYTGKKPRCEENSLVLSLSHETSDIRSWRFPANTTASIVIDGSPVPLKIYSQLPYAMPKMANYLKDPMPSEDLIISPGCPTYQRLRKAKTVEFQIGNASFELSPEGVDNFRDFAKAIGY